MTRPSSRHHRQPWLIGLIVSLLLPPLLAMAALLIPGTLEVAATGQCPAAPPDIPPYPCSVWEYLLRMTLGPWALLGWITLILGWWVLDGMLWAVVWVGYLLFWKRDRHTR